MNSSSSSWSPSVPSKGWLYALMGLALVGFADSAYLTVIHFTGAEPACSIVKGCEVVLTSKWAEIGIFPTAGLGIFYYGALFFLSYLMMVDPRPLTWSLLRLVVSTGVLFTLGFIYLQIWVIGALCQFCMISAVTTAIIAIIITKITISSRRIPNEEIQP